MSDFDKSPNRAATLFEQIFAYGEANVFDRISGGISATLDNTTALLEEAALLVTAKRYQRAEFLIATAQEEMGKAYILMDMTRVNQTKQDILRRLCRAFYDHVLKHVYFDLCAHRYSGIWELEQVRHYFGIGIRKWWPALTESGEPDMPHDTYFLREANLYVDFDSFAGIWTVPSLSAKSVLFETPLPSPLDDAQAALQRLRATQDAGLFSVGALRMFHECVKRLPVTESTPSGELLSAYERAGKELEATPGIPQSVFMESQLRNWPLYWLVP